MRFQGVATAALAALAQHASARGVCSRKTVTVTKQNTVTVFPSDSQVAAISSPSTCVGTVTSTVTERHTVTVQASDYVPDDQAAVAGTSTVVVPTTAYVGLSSSSSTKCKSTITIKRSNSAVSAQAFTRNSRRIRSSTRSSSSVRTSTTSVVQPVSTQKSSSTRLTTSTTKTTSKTSTSTTQASTSVSSSSGSTVALGSTVSGEATFYGGNLNGGMCSFNTYTLPSGIYGTALSDSNWDTAGNCGACIQVHYGGKTLEAMVVDQCPGCGQNHLDLFQNAFTTLADASAGIIDVTWEYVACGITSPLKLRNKEGTSKYWFSMQVFNSNVPVKSLDVSTDGGSSWKSTTRKDYNFFEISSGTGTDTVDVRVTSSTGKTITVKNVSITAGVETSAGSNFSA